MQARSLSGDDRTVKILHQLFRYTIKVKKYKLNFATVETITLGQNGPAVTPLCIGTWAWGDKLFWNY
ncbi:MAG: hypothetical protein ACYT04_85875, partial [Nostoc sp.]